jgi:hypothetical protein
MSIAEFEIMGTSAGSGKEKNPYFPEKRSQACFHADITLPATLCAQTDFPLQVIHPLVTFANRYIARHGEN